ncbi:prepilin-type N-terminal cleavage/methylation domain-containing protein [Candidatus Sumerlaeota bacterium]|nr:prepilin-type N-terminal cleavage/methylation domain-containing protein [Candidatus Sumerlaeota bacterium]
MERLKQSSGWRGVTLLELLVVVLIISILTAMAVNIYIDQTERARFAACKSLFGHLAMGIERYRIDTGEYPLSSSGTILAPSAPNPTRPFVGCGYMYISLTQSLNGSRYAPLGSRWAGPYFDAGEAKVGTLDGQLGYASNTDLPEIQILDPWDHPVYYVRSGISETPFNYPYEYELMGATEYPGEHPLASSETWFNASTYQLISGGPDGVMLSAPVRGLGDDDVTNFDGAKKSLRGYEGVDTFEF